MSGPRVQVDDADRRARVKLSSAIEPGERVTGLVSELGAAKVLDYQAICLSAWRSPCPRYAASADVVVDDEASRR